MTAIIYGVTKKSKIVIGYIVKSVTKAHNPNIFVHIVLSEDTIKKFVLYEKTWNFLELTKYDPR